MTGGIFLAGDFKHPYLASFSLVAAATVVGKTLLSQVAPTNQVMLYLLTVVLSGLWWGRGATVFTSLLGVLAFDVLFVPPLYKFNVADAQYGITFVALLTVALVVGTLTSRLRDHAEALRVKEAETAALFAFSRKMVAARGLSEISRVIVDHVGQTFGRPVSLRLPDGTLAGPADATGLELPLRTKNETVGTLLVADGDSLGPGRQRLLEALAAQAAIAVERALLAEAARRADLLIEAERLQDALLHSISHSLRTPLASIIGSLSALLEPNQSGIDPATRKELVETAREEAERLNGLVGQLLDMARLETGHLTLLIDKYDLEDVIGAALGQAERQLREHPVSVDLPEALPLVPLDQALIVQVLDNLLSNAAKYSPPGSPIELRVRLESETVHVGVADRGYGVPEADRQRIFEKFYRVQRAGSPIGTGLGLAVCKGIVEAHQGRIWAESRPGGGTVFTFTLPVREEGARNG